MQFGNQDKEKKYDLSHIFGIKEDSYVVRHFETITQRDGKEVEDSSTSRFQVYSKDKFRQMSHQAVVKNVQQKSLFQELGLNVHVLHEPAGEASKETSTGEGTQAPVKPRKADDIIADINVAENAAAVDALILEGEARKTVLAAAEARKATFTGE